MEEHKFSMQILNDTWKYIIRLIYFSTENARWMTPIDERELSRTRQIKWFVTHFRSLSRGVQILCAFWKEIKWNIASIISFWYSAKSCRVESHHIECVCNWISIQTLWKKQTAQNWVERLIGNQRTKLQFSSVFLCLYLLENPKSF